MTTDQTTTTDVRVEQDVEVLAPSRCWALLRGSDLGRLAVVVGGGPDVFPVTYVADHGTVVFRTAGGTKLDAALARPVALEADGTDADGRAWSVVVHGTAHRLQGLHEQLDAVALPLRAVHPGPKPHLVRIEVARITGRLLPAV